MQFACIATQKADISLARLCAYAGISISGYYACKQRVPSRRKLDDMMILAHIRNQFALSRQTYVWQPAHACRAERGRYCGRGVTGQRG